ncbi:MAG: hypothetical protein ABUL58_06655, partial [Steroidobacter sp.]
MKARLLHRYRAAAGSMLLLVLFISLDSVTADAGSMPVYFGGFAFLGDFNARSKLYPYTSAIVAADTAIPSQLDRGLNARLQDFSNASFSLELNKLGSLRPDAASAIAVAFALDRETVSVERIAGQYKLLIELSAQALFFDFKEKSVLASFPVTIQYIDLKQHQPDPREIEAIVKSLYLGSVGVNVFDEFVSTLKGASFNPSVNHRLRVTEVRIADEAQVVLPSSLKSDDA